ncbi:MAG: DUF1269 domain-containing protein [Candidatus Promineifilaceae bacterium]|jgi:uncharacterized membrane protein
MSDLIVITFDNVDEAAQVRDSLRSIEKEGLLRLDDSAVVVREEDGKVHVKDELDRGVKVGAMGGGLLGLFIGFIFFPLGAIVMGVLGGALVGASANIGISKKFVKEVTESLQPGTSAIFFVVRDGNPNALVGVLRPYKGEIYQDTLSTEDEETLRRVLSKRQEK